MNEYKMAENSKGGILGQAGKILRRRKTKVLQSLGKTGRTTDETLGEDVQRLERQQEVGNKFQKDLRNYINHARALSVASKTFYTTLTETYEPEWENHAQVAEILTNMDMLWQDYLQKLQEQVQDPLTKYLTVIPQIKARVSKRGRKMIDYDNAKHILDGHLNAKKKDDAKTSKAQEDMEAAKKIYDDLNNELHQELPEFYNSRLRFYGNTFQSLFDAETVFQTEAGKGTQRVSESGEKLAADNDHHAYTPRKNVRNTNYVGKVEGKDRGNSYRDSLQIPFFYRYSGYRSDENLTNGHSGQDSPQPDTPSPSTTPTSPAPQEAHPNGATDADTSRDSIEVDEPCQNADLMNESNASDHSEETAKVEAEVKVDASKVEASPIVPVPAARPQSSREEKQENATEVNNDLEPKVNGDLDDPKVNGDLDDPKVNDDLDTSTSSEHEVPNEEAPPPPPPTTLPPDVEMPEADTAVTATAMTATAVTSTAVVADTQKEDSDDEDDHEDEDLYQVPPPAKPIDDDLPPNYIYTVTATHTYRGEDDDELTFDTNEVIYVCEYDDPDEQDPGWLMGMRKLDRKMGVFPENFTKRV